MILADLVSERGFEPMQAFTGNDGLKMAQEHSPDIILLDIMLPDLDGYKICESLKLDRKTNPIPLIMVTALSAEENRIQGFRVGADAYVSKPYTPEDIAKAIESATAHSERLEKKSTELHIRFDLESEVDNLQNVNELFGVILRHTNLSEKGVIQLTTALLEVGSNAIEWGNK